MVVTDLIRALPCANFPIEILSQSSGRFDVASFRNPDFLGFCTVLRKSRLQSEFLS